MTLQQLRYLCAIADHGFNVSQAAVSVHTSQPGISTQIRALERELKAEILLRRRGRIVGLTSPGEEILQIARRMLRDADNLRKVGAEHTKEDRGTLVLAMTHTHARYVLRRPIERFRRRFPGVQLVLRQGNAEQVYARVASGEVDIGIANEPPIDPTRVVTLRCHDPARFNMARCVLVPVGHPLLKKRRLGLEDIARYPLITLDTAMTAGRSVKQAFENAGLVPNIVMHAIDADIMKTYVQAGLGVAVFPAMAYEKKTDRKLRLIEASDLFGTGTLVIALNGSAYLRGYMHQFIEMLAPEWNRAKVEETLKAGTAPA